MEYFILVYFGFFIGESKKTFKSQIKNLAPCFESDITLFINILNFARFVADAPESMLQSILSPLTTIHTWNSSGSRGRCSQTYCAYLTFLLRGTSDFKMNYIVSVDITPCIFPCAKRLSSMHKRFSHISFPVHLLIFQLSSFFPVCVMYIHH